MRKGILLSLAISFLVVAVCRAEPLSHRSEAQSQVDRLRKTAPPPRMAEEYQSIVATFDTAESLTLKNQHADAEKLYQLTLLKVSLFDKKLPPLDSGSTTVLKQQPVAAAPGVANGGKNANDAAPHRTSGSSTATKVASISPPSDVIQDGSTETTGTAAENREEQAGVEDDTTTSPLIVGKEFVYTVKKRESLKMVGAKLGVSWRIIAQENELDPSKPLTPGQELTINTRRIIPKTLKEGIIINIPDRTLYLFKGKKLEKAVPVALGMPVQVDYGDWRTPTGHFRIISKMKNPTWHVPPSIQTEMKKNGRKVVTEVPPGTKNPLGKYAFKTSLPGVLIHSTSKPGSIFTFASHGCIRVHPQNMEELFPTIPVKTSGEIVYQPVKLAFSDDGRVFIEVHGDIYKRYKNLDEVARGLIVKNKAEKKVDWEKVRTMVRKKSGIPEDVTLDEPEAPQSVSKK
jgi:L,D-transpeptidase ErfK/SrfK